MEWISDPQVWMALATLTAIEIVLGVDNIVFIAILAGRLPAHQQARGRSIGLVLAMLTRIILLFSLTLIMRLTAPLFSLLGQEISGRDLILLAGGLFLIAKSTLEIHHNLEGEQAHDEGRDPHHATMASVIVQITLLDMVFSLDSVITAIGLANQLPVMIAAIVIAMLFMLFMAGKISHFIEKHPTVKILALSFLLLIGMALVGEGLELHIPKGYIYFAMAFSVFVEILNMKIRRHRVKPVKLRNPRSVKIIGSIHQTK